MIYRINIEEILSKIVEIEANSDEEAEEKAKYLYKKQHYVLDAENFQEVNFYIQ